MLLAAAGCGGSRPTTEEIAASLKSGVGAFGVAFQSYDDETITCIAEVLHDSGLSDEALTAMVEGDRSFVGSEEDNQAVVELKPHSDQCRGFVVPDQ